MCVCTEVLAKREAAKKRFKEQVKHGQRIVIDLGWSEQMTWREQKSMRLQIAYACT